jgi:hypothetical protein
VSARIVAVTTLVIEVMRDLSSASSLTDSEVQFLAMFGFDVSEIDRIRHLAVAEMQALAPAVLAADSA